MFVVRCSTSDSGEIVLPSVPSHWEASDEWVLAPVCVTSDNGDILVNTVVADTDYILVSLEDYSVLLSEELCDPEVFSFFVETDGFESDSDVDNMIASSLIVSASQLVDGAGESESVDDENVAKFVANIREGLYALYASGSPDLPEGVDADTVIENFVKKQLGDDFFPQLREHVTFEDNE